MYGYDQFGWYTGISNDKRSTLAEPTNTSLTTTPGELRSNWTGHTWLELPFVVLIAPEPTIPAEPIPYEITNWQCKKQLLIEGKYEAVDTAIASMGVDAQVDWQHAAVFKRDYPLILGMQQLLNQTNADVDAFFVKAAKL